MKKKSEIEKWVRPNVRSLKPYASARTEFNRKQKDMVLMDANENPFDTLVNRYPDPEQQQVKNKLAELKGLRPEQIFLGNGSDEILDLLIRAFCSPGEEAILTMPPTFGMFKVLAHLNDVEVIQVPLTPRYEIDVAAVCMAIKGNCKMIMLCSPNNPTGNSFDTEAIRTLLEHFEGIFVLDEAYVDFSAKSSWTGQLANYPNLVITQTLSKAYGQAGVRLGIAYADQAIIDILRKIKLPYNVNVLTQQWALERLNRQEEVEAEIRTILKEKERLYQALEPISWVEQAFPSDTNFILVRVDDGPGRYRQLLESGIVVRNRSTQKHCENSLRITVGTPEENEKLIHVLNEIP